MNEITRIHIAKVTYDIAIDAKKALEAYSKQLATHASDVDVMDDVEVRMTELLAQRGVVQDGVITLDDVQALRTQLGEPHEFADDTATIVDDEPAAATKRRLYRDIDSAALGGVLSGIGKYFGINPLWIRLGFVIILFASIGTAMLLYVLLWFVVPPAKTAAEKLELEGRPVTLAAMKELRDQAEDRIGSSNTAELVKNLLRYALGTLAAIGAVGAIIVVGVVSTGLLTGTSPAAPFAGVLPDSNVSWVAYSLFVASGLLLASLGSLIAYACFSRRLTKRISIAIIAVILAGVASFGSGVGMSVYSHRLENERIDALRTTTRVTLPADAAQIKKLIATGHSANDQYGQTRDFTIKYVVDPGQPRYVLEALPDVRPDVRVSGDTIRVALKMSQLQANRYGHMLPNLTIYGPALDNIEAEQGNIDYTAYYKSAQPSLVARANLSTNVTLFGDFDQVTINGGGSADATMATIRHLSVDNSEVAAGVVQTLTVLQPDACRAFDVRSGSQNEVVVQGVSSGEVTYNGQKIRAATHRTSCGMVQIGDDDEE